MQSFAIEQGALAVPAAQSTGGPALGQAAQLQLQQAPTLAAIPDNRAEDATMKALFKLGGDALAPLVQEEAQRQFMVGVGKAMEGKALKEIVDEQPWYTNIFGPSNASTGARVYTKQAQVAQFVADVQNRMPELVKQPTSELQKYAYGSLKSLMTGDAMADGMITQEVTEKFAPLFASHAKGHYEYVQKEAYGAQQGAWSAIGKSFNKAAAEEATSGMMGPGAVEAQFGNVLKDLQPFPGQSDESYERGLSEFLVSQAAEGNYHTIKRLRALGLVDNIKDGSRRAEVERAINAGATRAVQNAVPQLVKDMVANTLNLSQDADGFLAARASINARAAAITGVDDAKVYPDASTDNDLLGWLSRKNAAEASGTKARADAAQESMWEQVAAEALKQGVAKQAIANGSTKADYVQRAADRDFLEASKQGPAAMADVINRSKDFEFQAANTYFANTLNRAEYDSNFGIAAETVALLPDKSVLGKYLSPEQTRKLLAYNRLTQSGSGGKGMEPAIAFQIANSPIAEMAGGFLPSKVAGQSKAVRAAVKDKFGGWFSDDIDEASMRMAERVTGSYMKTLGAETDDETAAGIALNEAIKTAGLQQVGKRLLIAANPRDSQLKDLIGFGERDTSEAFESIIADIAKANGLSGFDNYQLIRRPDQKDGGKTRAAVYLDAYTDDGRRINAVITSDRLKERAEAGFTTRHNTRSKRDTGILPITKPN